MIKATGEKQQTLKAAEELNELAAQAINTNFINQKRGNSLDMEASVRALAGEVADVETVLIQMGIVFKFDVKFLDLGEHEDYTPTLFSEVYMLESIMVLNTTAEMLLGCVLGLKHAEDTRRQLEATLLHVSRIKSSIPTEVQTEARIRKAAKFRNYLEQLDVPTTS